MWEVDNNVLKVYPHPFTDYVNIHTNKGDYYEFLDQTGAVVKSGGSALVSTVELKPGFYILKYYTPESIFSKRVIKVN